MTVRAKGRRLKTGGVMVAGSEEPRSSEFIKTVKHIMVERDIANPNELYRLMRDKDPEPSRATIHGYFNGTITPQPWFLRALAEVCEDLGKPLTEDEEYRLQSTYIASY